MQNEIFASQTHYRASTAATNLKWDTNSFCSSTCHSDVCEKTGVAPDRSQPLHLRLNLKNAPDSIRLLTFVITVSIDYTGRDVDLAKGKDKCIKRRICYEKDQHNHGRLQSCGCRDVHMLVSDLKTFAYNSEHLHTIVEYGNENSF